MIRPALNNNNFMDNTKTFEEKIEELKKVPGGSNFHVRNVSVESLNQMIKANELKYIEKVIDSEEENRLVEENLADFLVYPEEIQRLAIAEYPKVQGDPDYFTRDGANKEIIKPCIILGNIENKKNEAKIKNWEVEYRARLINRLKSFKAIYPEANRVARVIKCLAKAFSK